MNPSTSQGAVRIVKDLIIHVEFGQETPEIGELIVVNSPNKGLLLVQSLAPNNIAICLNVLGDRTIEKNMVASLTGRGIEVPVGPATIGRIFSP